MRNLAGQVSRQARTALNLLIDRNTSPDDYGQAFFRLGKFLAKRLMTAGIGTKVLLVCTSEDADYLARGVFEMIKRLKHSDAAPVAFACFWQARFDPIREGSNKKRFEVAPIIKRYEEPIDDEIDSLIVVKSIIATSCVVRHALLDTIARKHPKKIFVVAPVIARDAPDSLRAEFPRDVAKLFEFIYFAEDDSPDSEGIVHPGIGGSVYERLPLPKTSGLLVPRIVTERRSQRAKSASISAHVRTEESHWSKREMQESKQAHRVLPRTTTA
jgi:hypothetical protein